MAEHVRGHCAPAYSELKDAFEARLASSADGGGSLAVIEDGALVVDLWGGTARPVTGAAWDEHTLVNTWSISKSMTTLTALVLVDRGILNLDRPVCEVWEAFGQAGKEAITLRHILSHASGLPGWDGPVDIFDICDLPAATAKLAAQAPWWPPGTQAGYHILSFGHLISGLIHAATGKWLGQVFRDEIAGPLGADYHFGLPITEHRRVADTYGVGGPPPLPAPETIAFKAFTGPLPVTQPINSILWRSAENGAAGGQGNARSIAQVQQVLSHGGVVAGKRLLSEALIDEVLTPHHTQTDMVLGRTHAWGLGYILSQSEDPAWLPNRRLTVGTGAGGSLVINDHDRRTTFAYVMNRMEPGLEVGNDNSRAYFATFDAAQNAALTV